MTVTVQGPVDPAPAVGCQVVTFQLGAEAYAVPVAQVQEIVRPTAITRVPRSPAFVEGVINLRGRIIPVVDLARRLGLPTGEDTRTSRIVVTTVAGNTIGMRVDAVSEVLSLTPDQLTAPPELTRDHPDADCFTAVATLGDRLLILLDLARVLDARDVAALAQGPAGDGAP